MIFGSVLGSIWRLWTLENHAKVCNYMQFQGLDPFDAESVSGSVSGRGLGCVFQDLGADWGTHWIPFSHFEQFFLPLFLEAVFGRQLGVKTLRNGWGRRQGRGLLACFWQMLNWILHA